MPSMRGSYWNYVRQRERWVESTGSIYMPYVLSYLATGVIIKRYLDPRRFKAKKKPPRELTRAASRKAKDGRGITRERPSVRRLRQR